MPKIFLEQSSMAREGRIMGTRSNVYVETEPGTYIGTYCHYDGYPSHMCPTLALIDNDKLAAQILIAAPQGGFRVIHATNATEYLGDHTYSCLLENPQMEDLGPDYVYIKCLDGRVKWRDTYAQACEEDYGEEDLGWRFTYEPSSL